eukprot:scaffold286686_cov13-Tisochrysis_lutea.AAC.1
MIPKEVQCPSGKILPCNASNRHHGHLARAAVVASGEKESHFSGSGKEHQGSQAAMKAEQMRSQEGGQRGKNK